MSFLLFTSLTGLLLYHLVLGKTKVPTPIPTNPATKEAIYGNTKLAVIINVAPILKAIAKAAGAPFLSPCFPLYKNEILKPVTIHTIVKKILLQKANPPGSRFVILSKAA